jgi:ABC-type histidine transport system ATPase subunit
MHEGKVWEEGPPKQVLIEPETEQLRNFIKSVLV